MKDWLKRFFRHPVSVIFWITVFSLIVKENYPFSHFPMYKSFGERSHYFYVKSGEELVPVKRVFKVSVPRIKKYYGGHMEDIAEERSEAAGEKIRPYQLPDDAKIEAGKRLLGQLREGMREKQKRQYAEMIAKPFTLMRVDIIYEDGEFKKPEHVVTSL